MAKAMGDGKKRRHFITYKGERDFEVSIRPHHAMTYRRPRSCGFVVNNFTGQIPSFQEQEEGELWRGVHALLQLHAVLPELQRVFVSSAGGCSMRCMKSSPISCFAVCTTSFLVPHRLLGCCQQ